MRQQIPLATSAGLGEQGVDLSAFSHVGLARAATRSGGRD